MSPEQARAKELDARTDLFSFGAVLYEMATGQLPFRGDSTAIIFDAILNRPPVAPVRLNPEVPDGLERLINRALEKDRNLRYQSASDMKAELSRLKRDMDTSRVSVTATSDDEGRASQAVPPSRTSGSKQVESSSQSTPRARGKFLVTQGVVAYHARITNPNHRSQPQIPGRHLTVEVDD